MKAFEEILIAVLRMFAGVQLLIAGANLSLALGSLSFRNFQPLPLPTREILGLYCWFSGFIVTACGVLTWRFAREFVQGIDRLSRWLAGTIGLFWGFKAVAQFGFSVVSVWQMRPLHLVLFMTYGGIALCYLAVAGRPTKAN